jgi:hypothetical protein
VSRAGHHRRAQHLSRNGLPLAFAVLPHERDLLLRALAELVEREGASRVSIDLEQMLRGAIPADCLRELEGELTEAAS